MVTIVELRTRWHAVNELGDIIATWYRAGTDLDHVCLVVALMGDFLRWTWVRFGVPGGERIDGDWAD